MKSANKKKPVRSKDDFQFVPEFNVPNRMLTVDKKLKHKLKKDGISIEGF